MLVVFWIVDSRHYPPTFSPHTKLYNSYWIISTRMCIVIMLNKLNPQRKIIHTRCSSFLSLFYCMIVLHRGYFWWISLIIIIISSIMLIVGNSPLYTFRHLKENHIYICFFLYLVGQDYPPWSNYFAREERNTTAAESSDTVSLGVEWLASSNAPTQNWYS